jgi:CheY-like chemotaxis protein
VCLVERLLARRGDVEVISTMQGRMGFALAYEHRPALILLDLHLPDIAGDELLVQLRHHPLTATNPVVVSADATDHQIERLLAPGANAYLTKPLDLQELLAALTQALDPASATR